MCVVFVSVKIYLSLLIVVRLSEGPPWREDSMGATENAGFNAKVQRNIGHEFVTKVQNSTNHCENFNHFTAWCK